MNRDEVRYLLRLRSTLTNQPYGDDTIDAWLEPLRLVGLTAAKEALYAAAHKTDRVTLRAFHEELGPAPRSMTAPEQNRAGECMHLDADQGSSCPACGQYLPTWEEGYAIALREAELERARIAARRAAP